MSNDEATGGEQRITGEDAHREGGPSDEHRKEPLGPMTPDPERPLGDTKEAHDEISPHDLPKDHPGRAEAEREAAEGGGTTRGNV